MKTVDVNPEWKVSTHQLEESTHQNSGQFRSEMSTHELKSRHMKTVDKKFKFGSKVSTHGSKVSTNRDRDQSFENE